MNHKETRKISVGNVQIPMGIASDWIRAYTDEANASIKSPYAFPAYDRYNKEQNDVKRITDADLLAPALLNVGSSIRSYYELQKVRERLESALAPIDPDRTLVSNKEQPAIEELVKPLYSVLDDSKTRPWGVRATTLSKILHRKRPKFLVLHDQWVRACYYETSVPAVKGRSTSDYMVAMTCAIAEDLRNQVGLFDELDKASHAPGELSHVRLIDILAWKSKGNSPS